MFIKDPYSLLAEAAELDLSINTAAALTESQVNTIMESFDEVDEDVVYTAEMVSVIKVGDDYLTEMNTLYPYMKSNNITSVAEALNNVAAVNGLQEKAVGLLIESDDRTAEMIQEACKKGGKAKEKALDKIKKATKIPAKLKKEGFPVKKKKGKESAKDECGANGCKSSIDEFKSDIEANNKARLADERNTHKHSDKPHNSTSNYVKGNQDPVHNKDEKDTRDLLNKSSSKALDDVNDKKDKERQERKQNESSIFDFDLQ